MTYTEQYNQYVQEWIKENPAFSGPYHKDMLEFDQWVDKYMIEFAEWFWINKDKFYKGERDFYLEFNQLLEIFKKEKGL